MPVGVQHGQSARFPARRILIVEDEDATRTATQRYLQYCGHSVADAATVDEGIVKAEALHPEVLICDWKLNGKRDGIDVARVLKAKYGVAIIFVTAYGLDDLRAKIGDLGDVECLRKPISLETLASVLQSVDISAAH